MFVFFFVKDVRRRGGRLGGAQAVSGTKDPKPCYRTVRPCCYFDSSFLTPSPFIIVGGGYSDLYNSYIWYQESETIYRIPTTYQLRTFPTNSNNLPTSACMLPVPPPPSSSALAFTCREYRVTVGPVGEGLQGVRVSDQPIEAERCNPLPSGRWPVAHDVPQEALA